MSEVKIGTDVLKSVVEFMQGADGIFEKQASFEDATASEGSSVVDALVSASLVDEQAKSACVEKLQNDPVYTFELLKRAAEKMQEPEAGGVGVAKEASTEDEPNADQAFIDALM